MDYVVGSVAALISGNVTPNRPKLIKRALTPTKHQPSPNVTPKSEFVDDRSIFLSPTLQKKKAIVKKSPKRIFQNPDLDTTEQEDTKSPKAEKVKKHLQDELEADEMGKKSKKSLNNSQDKSFEASSPQTLENSDSKEITPKKKKKRDSESNTDDYKVQNVSKTEKSPKKLKQRPKSADRDGQNEIVTENTIETDVPLNQEKDAVEPVKVTKKSKKNKSKIEEKQNVTKLVDNVSTKVQKKKKKKKNKNQESNKENKSIKQDDQSDDMEEDQITDTPNPNAVTDKDTDSEHESDNEIESENEEVNKELLQTENADESSDEEEAEAQKKPEKKPEKKVKEVKEKEIDLEDEIKRTIFVGNVPLSKKTRKEIKKIFKKHGDIQTVRIRFVPVKDARVTPKMAVIKNELHPERSTVNVYVKFADASSIEKALSENNTVLNGHHLRVSRSESTGAERDPHLAVFVGNLPFGIEDDQLRSVFDKCGEIESVRIVRDKKTNAGKGFGYVNFKSKDGVELALNLSEEDLTIKNRIIRVKRSTQTLGLQKQRGQGGQKPGGRMQGQGGQRPGGRMQGQGGQRPGGRMQGKGGERFGGREQGQRFGGREQAQGGRRFGGREQGQGGQRFGGRDQGQRGQRPEGRMQEQGPQQSHWNKGEEGAQRRIMNKRKFQESSEGPPNKRQNIDQPNKEKKQRKEFVGVTAEKKKKQKFNKGLKKKKVLSEILTKKKQS